MKRLFRIGAERHDVGKVTFSWHPEGNFLASAGKNGVIQITDRHGDIVDEIPMSTSSPITSLEWDKDGEYLAILQQDNGVVPLWNLSSKRVVPLETNLKDPTFLAWSKTGTQLAIGTAKGSLMIYNKAKKQKIPIVGKHSRRITCGSWSKGGNRLVLGSEDKTLTISNDAGDTLLHTELKHMPLQTHFTYNPGSNGSTSTSSSPDDNTVSANLNGKSLLLYNIMDEKEDPMELTFAMKENGRECRYGEIVQHHWFDDGLLLVGFSGGFLLSVSTGMKDLGEEKHCIRAHQNGLSAFSYNAHSKRVATAGEDGVRIIDTRDFTESKQDFISIEDLEGGRITHLCWSPDGQILTIGTNGGNVYNFLAKMAVLCATYKSSVAYLSSLREVSVYDAVRKSRPVDVTLKLEPSIIAVGAKHVAAGMNNRVYFHRITPSNAGGPTSGSSLVSDQEYVGTVREVQLNGSFAVVLTDSKATIHAIEPQSTGGAGGVTRTFPNREEGAYSRATSIALTDDFLFYGTEAGTVEMFFLAEWVLLAGAELRLDNAVKKLFPNHSGSRVVVVDSAGQSFLFNPVTGGGVNQSITKFEGAPQNVVSVLWDLSEKNIIMIFDGKCIHSFIYVQTSVKGPLLIKLGPISVSPEGEVKLNPDKVEIAAGNIPLLSSGGTLACQTGSGSVMSIVHPFFTELLIASADRPSSGLSSKRGAEFAAKKDKKILANKFCQALALLKLEQAWEAALDLDRRQFWLALSGKAMELLNIELAMRVYRQLGDAGMVMALQQCMFIEDRDLLAGHISMLFCDYQRAQDLFMNSSRPTAALDMRRDLLQWDQALKLAQVLDPMQVPDICVRYGQQLEFREEVDPALKMFESALNAQDEAGHGICPESLVPHAMMGVARCNLRLGNIRQGIRLANELDDRSLFVDCGDILEKHKQYSEAAAMYIKGLQYEKAAHIYTKHLIKNDRARISEATVIMEKVDNDSLNSTFAKACAAAGRYEDAARAYSRAKDTDKVVELQLRQLDQVQQAFDLVRITSSAQGAQVVAEYCQETNDFRGAIEFLLIANKSDEAFKLAQAQQIVDVYTNLLGESISADDATKVAHYYEKAQDFGKAGKFYALCGQHARALRLFLQCGDRHIDDAIDVVGKSHSENLTHQLLDFLVGEKDGVPKDPNYIYRLYLALEKFEDAAKTALLIARQEQDLGNYALAHSVIQETIRKLEEKDIKVSLQLRQTFVLLHSYLLVKSLVRRGDHMMAARLLLRVTQNVSKFPTHVVQFLTSTVIECQRAGLKGSSYENAVILMRPEYRASIDQALKRKIESIVRRRAQVTEDPPEDVSIDPISSQLIPVTQLESPVTRDALPMCVVSGKHMVLTDWCFCPISKFPALYSEYVRYIEDEIKLSTSSRDDAIDRDVDNESKRTANGSPGIKSTITSSTGAVLSGKSANVYLSAPDPIMGMSVSVNDLILTDPADAMQYVHKYNNMIEKAPKKEEGEDQDEDDGDGDGGDDDINVGDGEALDGKTSGSSKKKNGKKEKGISRARAERNQRRKEASKRRNAPANQSKR